MTFYDLNKDEREQVVKQIFNKLLANLNQQKNDAFLVYFSDQDTYIRKTAYQALGRIYVNYISLQTSCIVRLEQLFSSEDFKIRQTVINAAGEIGKIDFKRVVHFFDKGLFDEHHSPRNAVIGSIKKMSEVNPIPVLDWAKNYLHHPDKEIRREICHGIELRGRTHPQDILPLLKELEFDQTARVKNTLIHVLGQIAYKKGCLEIVLEDLKTWQNKELVSKALLEIIDIHHRYRNFSFYNQQEAIELIEKSKF